MNHSKYKAYIGIEIGYKRCCKCYEVLLLSDFGKRNDTPDGKRYDCKFCSKARKKRARENRPHIAGRRKNDKLIQKYGITLDQYNLMLLKQENMCSICGTHLLSLNRALDVDHDHKTGKVRSLLCNLCNVGLGAFKDDINLLCIAINYLNLHKNA